jgi:hypothetical protein
MKKVLLIGNGEKEKRDIATATAFILAMSQGFRPHYRNPPDADNKVISPPQLEESKQFYLNRAEEKRRKKKLKQIKEV